MAIDCDDLVFDGVKIGEGSTAAVWKARHIRTPIPVAVKQIPKSPTTNRTRTQMIREITLHRQIDHPFISKLFAVLENEIEHLLVQEFLEHGSLLSLVNLRTRLPEKLAHRYFIQLICAIDYLHRDRHVAHRDIKCENILLDKFDNIRVIDFGLSRAVQGAADLCTTQCGSPAYVAPEVVLGQGYGFSPDIWSCGIVLFGMVAGYLPFFDRDPHQNLTNILSADLAIPAWFSPSLADLISRILCKDPKTRIDLDGIIRHPWFAGNEYQAIAAAAARYSRHNAEIEEMATKRMKEAGIDCAGLAEALENRAMTEIRVIYEIYERACVSEIMQTVVRRADSGRSVSLSSSAAYRGFANQKRSRGNETRMGTRLRYPILGFEPGEHTRAKLATPGGLFDLSTANAGQQAMLAAPLPRKGVAGM
jgi:serine/threonine protein kinase